MSPIRVVHAHDQVVLCPAAFGASPTGHVGQMSADERFQGGRPHPDLLQQWVQEERLSAVQVGHRLGLSRAATYAWLRRYGIARDGPRIAQAEFAREDVQRVVPLIVAIGQGTYAFAPAAFGALRALSANEGALVFVAAAIIQALAIAVFLSGRRTALLPAPARRPLL